MKAVARLLALLVLVVAAGARAEESFNCEAPAHLLASESSLGKVAEAVKSAKHLDILVVGSRSSMLDGPDGAAAAYPARLQATLRDMLPGIEVNVTTELLPKRTAEEVAAGLEKLAGERKPTLVIWQTGTVDAMRSIDPDEFRVALEEGIAALQKAGTDVVLMNLQYSPRMETILSVSPYNDTMRMVGQQQGVPLFDRFSIMREWHEAGAFDLFGAAHGLDLAKRVHNCLGRTLSALVIEAAELGPPK